MRFYFMYLPTGYQQELKTEDPGLKREGYVLTNYLSWANTYFKRLSDVASPSPI